MASEDIPSASQALTANGTSAGYVTVTDNSVFYPGAFAWLSSSNKNQFCMITDLPTGGTQVGLRFLPDPGASLPSVSQAPNYGNRSDCSAFTTLLTSRLSMPAQLVRVTQPQFSKILKA